MASGLAVRREIVTVCRRLWERGLIAGPDGNVSVRVAPDRILVTPAGLSKVDVGTDECQDDGGKRFEVQAIGRTETGAQHKPRRRSQSIGKRTSLTCGIEDTHWA